MQPAILVIELDGRLVAVDVDPRVLRGIVRGLVAHHTSAYRRVGLSLRAGIGAKEPQP